jgi:hypothetical protein
MKNPMGWPRWRALLLLPLLSAAASALLPPLTDYHYKDADRAVTVQAPQDWRVTKVDNGLDMQRDPAQPIFGAVELRFAEFDAPPTQDAFLDSVLTALGKRFTHFEVVSRQAPEGQPKVRLAVVSFSSDGVPCRGHVMTASGQQTGTSGFGWAEAVTARTLKMDDLVPMVVAGSYGAYTVRGAGDDERGQANDAAFDKLYAGCGKDFRQTLEDFEQKHLVDRSLMPMCASYQPILRELKNYLSVYLPERDKERVATLNVYCVPVKDFNAFCIGRNNEGPGFLCFYESFTKAVADAAQEYTALREQHKSVDEVGETLTAYTTALGKAVVDNQPYPDPLHIDFANPTTTAHYVKVFRSMMAMVVAHEMAHYYLRHAESGETGDNFSIQQREVAADTAAIQHLQKIADSSTELWEGGAIHLLGLLATVDNLCVGRAANAPQPEWNRTHPYGRTRLGMAKAALGADNFETRNDPWNGKGEVETGSEGVQVMGGATHFTHPTSKAVMTVPFGWVGSFDDSSGVYQMRPAGASGGLPMICYSCGGTYATPQAITDEILGDLRRTAPDLEIRRNDNWDTGNANIKAHVLLGAGTFNGQRLMVNLVGMQCGGVSHSALLMTPEAQFEHDAHIFDDFLVSVRFPG